MTTLDLLPFQRRFLKAAFTPAGIEVAALSLPRGSGKTTLLALLATRSLTPGDPLFVEGAQNVFGSLAASNKVGRGFDWRGRRWAKTASGMKTVIRARRSSTSRAERAWMSTRPMRRRRWGGWARG